MEASETGTDREDDELETSTNLMIMSGQVQHQHSKQNQQQLQDDQVTNCSETMSTNDDADDHDNCAELRRQTEVNNSVCRQSVEAQNCDTLTANPCDRLQLQTTTTTATNLVDEFVDVFIAPIQQAEEDTTTTMSQVSGNVQLPPSYGTATRHLQQPSVLDAGQLQTLMWRNSSTSGSAATPKQPQHVVAGSSNQTGTIESCRLQTTGLNFGLQPRFVGASGGGSEQHSQRFRFNGIDNNQECANDARDFSSNQQQQQMAPTNSIPINHHVISAPASMQYCWPPPQQNRLPFDGQTNLVASECGATNQTLQQYTMLNNGLSHYYHHQPQQQQQQQHQPPQQQPPQLNGQVNRAPFNQIHGQQPLAAAAAAAVDHRQQSSSLRNWQLHPSKAGSLDLAKLATLRPQQRPAGQKYGPEEGERQDEGGDGERDGFASNAQQLLASNAGSAGETRRKRRRHRSSSGLARANGQSPARNNDPQSSCRRSRQPEDASHNHSLPAGEQFRKFTQTPDARKAISAHCWLIDSSDDQQTTTQVYSSKSKNNQSEHLTVAIERQVRAEQQRSAGSCAGYGYATTRSLHAASQSASSHRSGNKIYAEDMTSELKTNSLRMDRILARHRPLGSGLAGAGSSGRPPLERCQSSFSSDESSSCGSFAEPEAGRHTSGRSNASSNANTLVRLSALLSVVSNLVRRPAKCLSGGSGTTSRVENGNNRHRRSRSCNFYLDNQPEQNAANATAMKSYPSSSSANKTQTLNRKSAASSNSANLPGQNLILGSLSAPSTANLAQYTAGSLAISSSSSTSAYATGSSSNRSQVGSSLGQPSVRSLIAMRQLNAKSAGKGAGNAPPSSVSTCGSFYSTSTNGFKLAPNSTGHQYEYCEEDAGAINDRKLIEQQPEEVQETQFTANNNSGTTTTTSSDSSRSSSSRFKEEVTMNLGARQEYRLAAVIMSDHELISAASDLRRDHDNCQSTTIGAIQVPSITRRRWWWNSLKEWARKPCNKTDHDTLEAGLTSSNSNAQSARYKSLRAARRRRRRNNQRDELDKTSTLQNVISLAKVDRVFRFRLLASVLVSCLLLALICLLVSLIYTRSIRFYGQQRSKFTLLIDDSDYDLSWLWPQHPNVTTKAKTSKLQGDTNQPTGRGQFQAQLDSSMRSHLQLIERSERLNQYQQTISHLTNIQLANDNYLDLTKFTEQFFASEYDTTDSSKTSNTTSSVNNSTSTKPMSEQLTETDHDLISLTLLSNLHWPLVKWRHQSQQSIADFLSFAMLSPATNYPQHPAKQDNQLPPVNQIGIRNLLSLLILAETAPEMLLHNLPPEAGRFASPINQDLQQLIRLNTLIRDTSHYLIGCSHLQTQPQINAGVTLQLKWRFCSTMLKRYKQMMLSLSQLNHHHLAELYDSIEMPLIIEKQQLKSSSKTLLSFFLDRLALLEARTIAELTLSDAEDLTDNLTNELSTSNKLIDYILQPEIGINAFVDSSQNQQDRWTPRDSLIDYAKLIVGEDPLRLNIELEREARETYAARLQQIKSIDPEAWREELATDLMYPWNSNHLPQFLSPNSYDLFLHPNLTTRLVLGMVKIEFQILSQSTRFIVISCDQLNLVELTLWQKQTLQFESGKQTINSTEANKDTHLRQIAIRRTIKDSRSQQIYIELHDPIEAWGSVHQPDNQTPDMLVSQLEFGELPVPVNGNSNGLSANIYVINLSYNKTNLMMIDSINEPQDTSLRFVQYADYYAQPEAEIKTLLYSHFEASNARKLFPCFDEPQFKAKFQLNLVHEQSHQVLFNSAKRERVPYTSDGRHQMSVFEATPIPMSTYSVAVVICDIQNIKSITSRLVQYQPPISSSSKLPAQMRQPSKLQDTNAAKHIQVQILAQFEHLSHAEFTSQLIPQLLAFYQVHLQQTYPMEKLDLVAIPKSLQLKSTISDQITTQQPRQSFEIQSSIENFGLLFFKSSLLLLDVNLISQDLIEQVSSMISHQLAHQFFGNIVTVRRWQDVWLYESLCQYLQSIALAQVQVDWKLDEQFPVSSIQETLIADTSISVQSRGDPLFDTPEIQNAQENSETTTTTTVPDMSLVDPTYHEIDTKFEESPIDLSGEQTDQRLFALPPNKRSAILHMLLFNLLPSIESQARLMRRCLSAYRHKTMSSIQFWHQFGEQLALEETSGERMAIDLSRYIPITHHAQHVPSVASSNSEDSTLVEQSRFNQTNEPEPNERVVFVRPQVVGGKSRQKTSMVREISSQEEDKVVESLRSNRLVDNLDLIANAWIERIGFPLITAHSYRDRVYLRQERFSFAWLNEPLDPNLDNQDSNSSRSSYTAMNARFLQANGSVKLDDVWPIPLMFVSRFNPKWPRFLWMDKRELEMPLTLPASNDQSGLSYDSSRRSGQYLMNSWFKLNVNQTSLVRVNYDERNWESLTELLSKSHYSNHLLNALDRANLLDDALVLMRSGKLSVGIAMNLTLYLEVGEREFQPWSIVLRHLNEMQTLLNQNPLWHRYVLKLLQPISSVIGWKDDGPHLMRKLRRDLFDILLQFGDEKTINKAKQEFKNWFKSNRFIVPNLQELVYVAGIRYGDQQEWFHCWNKYQQLVALDSSQIDDLDTRPASKFQDRLAVQASSKQSNQVPLLPSPPILVDGNVDNGPNAENEKRQLLTALASTQNTWLLEQFLNYSLDSSKIQPHHLKHVVQTLGKNPVARLYLWRFVRLNWNTLIDRNDLIDSSSDNYNTVSGQFHSLIGGDQSTNNRFHILEIMIMESTKHFATKLDLEEVKVFFDLKRKQHYAKIKFVGRNSAQWLISMERAMQRSLEVIRSNIYWRNQVEPKLTRWLTHHDSNLIN